MRMSIEKRAAILLGEIRAGKVTDWRSAISLHEHERWDLLHRALKRLRDRGLIKTSTEYNWIKPSTETREDVG